MHFRGCISDSFCEMALDIYYSPQFVNNLEGILTFFDERNGNDAFSRKLLNMIHTQIQLLSKMPEIGRQTDFPSVRILFVERYGIEYQIRKNSILIIDIYSSLTQQDSRMFQKK